MRDVVPVRVIGGPAPWRWPIILGAIALVAAIVSTVRLAKTIPPTSQVEVRPAPAVLLAMRDLARLETTSFHMERVLEIADHQTDMFGLLKSKDALLLVAVGDVVAGVDLQALPDDAVKVDWDKRSVRVTLPKPQIFSTVLDNGATHVYARTTDTLAKRKEDLEARAREAAEASMRQGAIDAGIFEKARTNADRSIRSMLRSLGFSQIEITWAAK